MNHSKVREVFLNFFKNKEHQIISSSSLLSEDVTVLFTTAGMQQFKPYFLGEISPYGNKITSIQKCLRTSDIDEVGKTPRHLTFFEMLGNFSFHYPSQDSYFKEESIFFAFELLNSKFKIQNSKLWITYFRGEKGVPEDVESKEIWQKLGFSLKKILPFSKEDNFWGPTGKEGPCGPTTEIHYDLLGKPCFKKEKCIPNCDCGRFIELWNLVFNEYYQGENGKLSPLKEKGADTGMGLERLLMILQKKNSVFETDLFEPIINEIKVEDKKQKTKESKTQKIEIAKKIIADHIKAAVFLISEELLPSNIERGYVLRRLLRRATCYGKILNLKTNFLIPLAKIVIEIYKNIYPKLQSKQAEILTVIQEEEEKFEKTLEKGLKELKYQISNVKSQNLKILPAKVVFDLYQSYGFPLELTEEIVKEEFLEVNKEEFKEEFKKHQEISRAGAEKKFGGIGKEIDYKKTKFHTATHLLHRALQEILGKEVKQMGSDITPERLRFDFSFKRKITPEEIKKIENLVNKKIKESLEIKREEMALKEALESGALAFFKEKYPNNVSVYTIFNPRSGEVFSKEICAGPHIKSTIELSYFKIIKEESSSAGIRRIKAIVN